MNAVVSALMDTNHVIELDQLCDQVSPNKRLLGLDLGSKTIGLALSDLGWMIASGFDTIKRKKFSHDAAQLMDICQEHDVGALVLGLPLNMDGSEGPRCQATRAFARNLAKLTDLPMSFWDERLSTAAATRTLLEADSSRKRRGEVIDKMAATLILQGVLDRINAIQAQKRQ